MASSSVREITLMKEIDRLEKDLQSLKSSQALGYDVTAVKETVTLQSYDFSIPPSSQEVYYYYFFADKQNNPGGIFVAKVTVGGLSTIATDAEFDFSLQDLTHYQTNPKLIKYQSNIWNNHASQTLYYKIYFYGTDTGRLVVNKDYNYA